LATNWAGPKFKFDAVCRVAPTGFSVSQHAAGGFIAVTFTRTASTPEAGTPPALVTVRGRVCCGLNLPEEAQQGASVGSTEATVRQGATISGARSDNRRELRVTVLVTRTGGGSRW
jgi:hypothetical protein